MWNKFQTDTAGAFYPFKKCFEFFCDVDSEAVKLESREMIAVKWTNFIAATCVLASRKKRPEICLCLIK